MWLLPTVNVRIHCDVYLHRKEIHDWCLVGKGNCTSSAEFNFYKDPEAANVVLHELGCRITMIPWEFCLQYSLPWVRMVTRQLANTNLLKRNDGLFHHAYIVCRHVIRSNSLYHILVDMMACVSWIDLMFIDWNIVRSPGLSEKVRGHTGPHPVPSGGLAQLVDQRS